MKTLELKSTIVGENELKNQMDTISAFVKKHWNILYEGAVRLGWEIPQDHYTCQRIQPPYEGAFHGRTGPGQTRLHHGVGVKYANGFDCRSQYSPKEEDIIEAVSIVTQLLNAASKKISSTILVMVNEPE